MTGTPALQHHKLEATLMHTYLKNSSLSPSSAILNISPTEKSITPRVMTANMAVNMRIDWNTSVMRTAFMPPKAE